MKRILKLSIFPVLTAVLIVVLALLVIVGRSEKTMQAEEASGSDGLVYADYFTGNSAHYEWQFGEDAISSKSPTLKNDAMLFDGYNGFPAYAMLTYAFPEKCDIYFTAELARLGEATDREPGIFLNIGSTYNTRYAIWFGEGMVTLTFNNVTKIIQKACDEVRIGKRNSYRLSLDGTELELYINGAEEPLFRYTATSDYENLASARNFGVYGRASEFWFDDLVVTDGSNLIPVTDAAICGKGGDTIEGIGTQMQMQAFLSPSNCTDKGLVWRVDDESLASITTSGLLTAKNYGTVTVTAAARDGSAISASYKIKIKEVKGAAKGEENITKKTWCLADEYSTVFQSDDPKFLYPMSPYVTVLKSGRIIATFDLNGDAVKDRIPFGYEENPKWDAEQHAVVAYSDDDGKTWKYGLECPGLFARAFEDGGKLYLILRDENGYLAIRYSEDEGETWSESFVLDTRSWHSAPTSIIYKGDCLYMTMEVNTKNNLAPILMRAKCGDDLTKKESWTFSEELALWDIIPDVTTEELDYTGLNEYSSSATAHRWLEGNVIQIYDEDHMWYDKSMSTFYIYLRATIGRAGYAAVMKVTEKEDGSMVPSVVTTEAGNTQLYVAMPGGHDKFSIIYDEKSGLYWLASNYSSNSMIKKEYTTGDMHGEPYMERDRLALYYSTDALNWNFAGMITEGDSVRESRAYPCLTVDGDDLLVVTRCGTEESNTLHDNNILSFHRIEKFRELVY